MAKEETYTEFIEKFKRKLTTDDCYTPSQVYEAVQKFVDKKVYPLKGHEIIRPFYPGGDYENYNYPADCVVLDNPPFSILSKIINFYTKHNIKFWLFAPSLTLFNSIGKSDTFTPVIVNSNIVFENGADINISFVTNIWPGNPAFVVEPCLHRYLEMVQKKNKPSKKRPKIAYPTHVVSSAILGKMATHGVGLICPRNEAVFIRKTDSGKQIYGGGLLISERMAAERMAAERMAAERMAPEQICLSERERAIVDAMGT